MWIKLNPTCIQNDTHAVCHVNDRYVTYNRLKTGGFKPIELNHPGYKTPEEAKQVCESLSKAQKGKLIK